jgi:negative regulator of flagellin synthesis FlgM
MKIGPLNDAALAAAAVGAAKPERGAAPGIAAPQDAGTSGVPVTVSAAARSLEAPAAGSGIDEAKVAAVRAAIADGSFKVNSEAIADKMLANAQEILSRTRS